MTKSETDGHWTVYILECRDGSLYTGITNDIEKRLQAHNDGTAARFTRGRGPVSLRYTEPHPDRSAASKREVAIKKLSRTEKLLLIRHFAESHKKAVPKRRQNKIPATKNAAPET